MTQLKQRHAKKSPAHATKSVQGSGGLSSSALQGGEEVPPFDSAYDLVNPKCPLVFFFTVSVLRLEQFTQVVRARYSRSHSQKFVSLVSANTSKETKRQITNILNKQRALTNK